ncbi:MAG: rhomboid family intramembrane serine protease [Bacteroidetes bacterium]|nr:rhomboid family intramembrane serine protease [Fibrella sp.]
MSITLALIILTCLVSFYALKNESFLESRMMNPYKVMQRGQYYRLLTSGFIHADLGHLFFNMFSFYFFGSQIESIFTQLFGGAAALYLILFYLAGIVISDIPTLVKHKNDPGYNSLGASGGVSSVIFGAILFFPLNNICLYGIICFPGFVFGLLYIGYSFYESRRGAGYINHDAHLYGALFGILFMAVVYPPVISTFFSQVSSWRIF